MQDANEDERRFAPATVRNREAIAGVLREVFAALPAGAEVLEIASGSGEHALHFSEVFSHLRFRPTDPDPSALRSIDAWRRHAGAENLQPAARIDVTTSAWPDEVRAAGAVAALFCANMIHIAPWEACEGLWRGGGALLETQAPIVLYGPFRREGTSTAPSNATFDASLRARDPRWGVRDLEAVVAEAEKNGFELEREVPMPANNLCLVFRRR